MAALRQVSADRWAWTDPVRRQGAFLEERLGDFGRRPGQDARGIGRLVLPAAELWAVAHPEHRSLELKKPQSDASRRAQMAVPEPFLERTTGDLEAPSAAQWAKQKGPQTAEGRPEFPWRRLAKSADARTEPL